MRKQDFYVEFVKLHRAFPNHYPADPPKMRHMFEAMQELELSWWTAFVSRVIKNNTPELSVYKAISGELKARKRAEETKKLLSQETSYGDGLENVLNELGCDSLLDAVLKSNKN